MFLPSNQKKFVNISTVSYKFDNKTYEVCVYPNKLYEYYNSKTVVVGDVVLTNNIFNNISKGEICPYRDIEKLYEFTVQQKKIKEDQEYLEGKSGETLELRNQDPFVALNPTKNKELIKKTIIEFIIENGYERKDRKTKEYELEMNETAILDTLCGKVTYNKCFVNRDTLRQQIKKIWTINMDTVKKQVYGIIKQLEKLGYERIKYKFQLENGINIKDKIFVEENEECNVTVINDGDSKVFYKINGGDVLHKFIEYCENKEISYFFEMYEEAESEDIC